MEIVICGVPFGTPLEKEALRRVKEYGFTSVQIYTFWKEFEPARGKFDWRRYDRQVALIQEAGLKYFPFILMGPKYAAPAWWLADKRHVGLRCLEHGKDSPIESIWNPAFRAEISRVLEAFAAHYLPMNVLEAVQPGICGDYGESIFPVVGNWPGDYHTHPGFWCGGADAVASFQKCLQRQYCSVTELNTAWRSHYRSFSAVRPFLRHQAPSRTAFFDLIAWYRNSMTEYSEFWVRECRRCFPDLPVYLCTGGMEELEHGSSFAAQAKVCAKHNAGLRLTNEGNKFYENFYHTSHAWAACRFYGAYLGLEPVGPMTEKGVRARVFGSIAYGNRQIFHYYGNIFDNKARPLPAAESLPVYRKLGGEREVEVGIGFFWPNDRAVAEGGMPQEVKETLAFIRHRYPVSPISEPMILDGALKRFRCLVMVNAVCARRAVLEKIAQWVRREGGTVLTTGRVCDLELRPVRVFDELFGILPRSEETWGHVDQFLREASGFNRLAKIPQFHLVRTWTALAPGTQMVYASKPHAGYSGTRIKKVTALFQRMWPRGGRAIFYSGPVNFSLDPEALFADPGVFPALLEDVCATSGVRPFNLQEGEIACARIDDKTIVLTENGIQLRCR